MPKNKRTRRVEYVVSGGAGHNGPFVTPDFSEAYHRWEQEDGSPTYFVATPKASYSLVKRIVIEEVLERGHGR